ncbi:MAG: Fe-S protein assembly chaperone HscA [Polyangia bacterium]
MSLFQIAEPGESRAKEACKGRVVGIDLGTTNSLVAVVQDGEPRCLLDADGHALVPSVVRYRKGAPPLVGRAAKAQAASAPHDTIASVKRLMGRGPKDVERDGTARRFNQLRLATPGADDTVVRLLVEGDGGLRAVTPVEVSAEILRALRQLAEQALDGELEGAVITVPAYFDDAQRQATKDAGRIAGLNVLRLLNEPTAAALAYGLDKRKEGRFAVYDLGGGTFDVSILDLREGIFTVLATAGDTALGGDDMDHALAELLLAGHPEAAAIAADAQRARGLLDTARSLKHRLTDAESLTVEVAGVSRTVDRAGFEAAIAPILARTATPCRRAMKDAELAAGELDGVILVGGATRVPAVRRFVAELFKREPLCDLDPDQVVALGAAVQADLLASDRTDALLIDVTPLSLGLELMGGVVEKILMRNSRVPCGAQQTFTTYADGQTGFDLHVVQGERETAAECRSLARFKLTGLPKMAAGMARLEVTFLVDENGILSVSAREATSGREAHVQVKPSYGLTDEQIEQMLLDSFEHAETDIRTRLLTEQRVEADRILGALAVALKADGQLLSDSERQAIEAAGDALAAARAQTDHRRIAAAIEALDHASKEFAQRRMNASLDRAVTGRRVDEIEKAVHFDPAHPDALADGLVATTDPETIAGDDGSAHAHRHAPSPRS